MPRYDPVRDTSEERLHAEASHAEVLPAEARNAEPSAADGPPAEAANPDPGAAETTHPALAGEGEEADAAASPSKGPLPYHPSYRWSAPDSVLHPITPEEVAAIKQSSQNPLRAPRVPLGYATSSPLKRSDSQLSSSDTVAQHYNKRRDVGRIAREQSPILPLRRFNNWAKSALIAMYSCPARGKTSQARVLDMGCGKGGDLLKWDRQNPAQLVMIDIAEVSVKQAKQRHLMGKFRWQAHLFAFNCFQEPLAAHLPAALLDPLFDTVSLQFCLHYGWDTEEHARTMLANAANYLRPGGTMIGTTPDADMLMGRLAALEDDEALAFGNDTYRIEFAHRYAPGEKPFGNRYRFWLEDAVDDVPEYVVDWPTLERLAGEYGLHVVYKARFDQVLADGFTQPLLRTLLERMQVIDPQVVAETGVVTPAMPPSMWDVCTLYVAFAFQKQDTTS